ncbi:tetratricopeptide repeat protein [Streptomyces sp. NPDC058690]|uniref:tetratricopeptide repeat protein n=1 Tax=Streptomyces sp. NPDC058690 TaxID=3346600 RepID=UPI003665A2F1
MTATTTPPSTHYQDTHPHNPADTHPPPPHHPLTDREQALAWLDAERENLIATAHAEGTTQATLSLGFSLGRYLLHRRRLQDLVTIRSLALDASTAPGANQAGAWNNLGLALREVRRFDEAIDAHQKALTLHQQTGDTHSSAAAWNNLGLALHGARRFDEAIDAHQKSLTLHQHVDIHNEAGARNNLGTALRAVRRFDEAIDAGERAAAMLAAEGDWFLTGEAWEELATTLDAAGADPARTKKAWERSAAAYTQAGATEEAETSRAHTDDPPPPQSSNE